MKSKFRIQTRIHGVSGEHSEERREEHHQVADGLQPHRQPTVGNERGVVADLVQDKTLQLLFPIVKKRNWLFSSRVLCTEHQINCQLELYKKLFSTEFV